MALERRLCDLGWQVYTLDGDNVRRGLSADLGFSPHDREENIRRIGEVSALFAAAVCITAFISPYRGDRARARAAAGGQRFSEVFARSALATCERRDPKGHYRKCARRRAQGFYRCRRTVRSARASGHRDRHRDAGRRDVRRAAAGVRAG